MTITLPMQVLSAATIVAKHTSALCNACRLASSKTPNPIAKRQFVQSAKEVANTTANLVKSIKVCNKSHIKHTSVSFIHTHPQSEKVNYDVVTSINLQTELQSIMFNYHLRIGFSKKCKKSNKNM